jgi:hypothetical protein
VKQLSTLGILKKKWQEYVDLKERSNGILEENYILSSSVISSWVKWRGHVCCTGSLQIHTKF